MHKSDFYKPQQKLFISNDVYYAVQWYVVKNAGLLLNFLQRVLQNFVQTTIGPSFSGRLDCKQLGQSCKYRLSSAQFIIRLGLFGFKILRLIILLKEQRKKKNNYENPIYLLPYPLVSSRIIRNQTSSEHPCTLSICALLNLTIRLTNGGSAHKPFPLSPQNLCTKPTNPFFLPPNLHYSSLIPASSPPPPPPPHSFRFLPRPISPESKGKRRNQRGRRIWRG